MGKYLIENALEAATNAPMQVFFRIFPARQGNWGASLGRHSCGLRECRGLHLAQMAGDVVAGEDFAHCRLLLRATL